MLSMSENTLGVILQLCLMYSHTICGYDTTSQSTKAVEGSLFRSYTKLTFSETTTVGLSQE